MSWHTSVLLVESESSGIQLLHEVGVRGSEEVEAVSGFEEATSVHVAPHLAVAVTKGWTVVCDPTWLLLGEDPAENCTFCLWNCSLHVALLRLSSCGARIFGFAAEGVSSLHGFTWYEQGWLLRAHIFHAGRKIIDLGDPLPQEKGLDADDPELSLITLMERLCLPLNELESTAFSLYKFDRAASFQEEPGPEFDICGEIRQMLNGTWCVCARDSTWVKPYPQCRTEDEICDAIRQEFRMPSLSTKADVDFELERVMWDVQRGYGSWTYVD
jgi:hypothetical protein